MLSTGKQSFQSFQLEIHTYLFYNNFKKKKREKEKFYLLTKKMRKGCGLGMKKVIFLIISVISKIQDTILNECYLFS